MTLAACARLIGVSPKWVLNTLRALGRPRHYSIDLARQIAITREIHESIGMPLAVAFTLARQTLRQKPTAGSPITVYPRADDGIALTIDLYRLLSAFNVRLAELRETYAPPALGRPRKRSADALATATDWGLDVSLIRDNMQRAPHQRLRQLDAMHAFRTQVRRVSAST